MTVCIASICGPATEESKKILAIADMKSSTLEGSNEMASIKSRFINRQWLALFAGNDISPCIPICTAVSEQLINKKIPAAVVSTMFANEYQKYLSKLAADKVLGRWNMSMEEFKATGRKSFGPDNFELLFHEIKDVRLSCQFLVCGFDAIGEPHIFTVRNPGIAENLDTPGYYAIGDGASAAMSILGFFKQNVITSAAQTYYNICAAKYMSESSTSTVGKNTFMWELSEDGDLLGSEDAIAILDLTRIAWGVGQPSIPEGVREKIKQILSARSEPEKSASEQ